MASLRVFVTLQFEGFHKYEKAPDAVAFLRDLHRHIFHVRAEWDVKDADREREFFIEKENLRREIAYKQSSEKYDTQRWSCEHWARWIGRHFRCARVEVSEDGENGAVWTC